MELLPGQVLYTETDGLYTVYKVLQTNETEVLVSCSWPSPALPDAFNFQTFDLRTACEAQPATVFSIAVLLAEEAVTTTEQQEVQQFNRIRAGIAHRAESGQELLRQADALLEQEDFTAALNVYTEAAPFARYDHSLFRKRGLCFLRAGRFGEAIADLEHSLDLFPTGTESLFYCAQAYQLAGRNEKALEKLEQLRLLDPNYPGIGEALDRLKRR